MMIKFENVSIYFENSVILENISFDAFKGEKVLLAGKSGIGKSSLIKAVLGFTDFSGEIQIDNLLVNKENIQQIRKMVSYMPQEISIPINPLKSFFQFSLDWGSTSKEAEKKAYELLQRFKIDVKLLEKQNSEVSGGQKQRILLTCCLAQDKTLYFLDEPDSSIDNENKNIIREYIAGMKDETIIIVSHDMGWDQYVNKTINIEKNG